MLKIKLFFCNTDKNSDLEVSPGNPHVTLKSDRTPENGSPVQIICTLEGKNIIR